MPGLAVAREMKKRGWRVTWIGTQKGMEGPLVAKDGIDFIGLNFQGVRGHGLGVSLSLHRAYIKARCVFYNGRLHCRSRQRRG